jgi:hypothetical protein
MVSRSYLVLPIDSSMRIGGIAPAGTSLLARYVSVMQVSELVADIFQWNKRKLYV